MSRKPNTDLNGNEFDDWTMIEVWKKARPFKHFELYKADIYGSVMFFDDFGIETDYGWEIGYILPVQEGGRDNIENLLPLNWKNNRTQSTGKIGSIGLKTYRDL